MRKNFDYEYVAMRQRQNDCCWRRTEKCLYYSYKNENYILPTIVGAVLCLPFNFGVLWAIVVILYALFLCEYNNAQLDIDPYVIKRRKEVRDYVNKYIYKNL